MRGCGLLWTAALGIGALAPMQTLKAESIDQPLKSFIRAVSGGELKVTDDYELGALSPFFSEFQSLGTYDDEDVFMALGQNSESELVLFAWMKSSRHLDLNQATDRWVEERLASVETTEDLKKFSEFRRLIRGAIYDVKASKRSLEAVAFFGQVVTWGETTEEAVLQASPIGFRFVSATSSKPILVHYQATPQILATSR